MHVMERKRHILLLVQQYTIPHPPKTYDISVLDLVRGLLQNVSMLGLDPGLMDDDIPPPFLSSSHLVLLIVLHYHLLSNQRVYNLRSYIILRSTHSYNQSRENIIRARQAFDADTFCEEMLNGVDGEEAGRGVEGYLIIRGNRSWRIGFITWSCP
ncbi:uncharacterized protein RAG0_06460 [Rhynchosporium agropyri]|uniref:Uncharacterized protein n=1 Tax=Rhynchosporium agropyri TaxID=914238 RepID=A0A1E1KH25_9HELO|nr:uncharacterized protein RAG0_06460 [Rhynchosporium agropyri]